MTADDIGPLTDAIVADHWGERRSWFEFVVAHPACRPLVAVDDDGRQLGKRRRHGQRARRLDRHDLGRPRPSPRGDRRAPDRGRARRRRGCRLPDLGPRRHRGRPAALREARLRAARPRSSSSRRPGPARTRAAPRPPGRPTRGSARSGPTTSRRWPASTWPRRARTARHLLRAFATPDVGHGPRRPGPRDRRVRGPRRRGAAAPPSPRTRTSRSPCSRRAAAGPVRIAMSGPVSSRRTRRGSPASSTQAGRRRGGRRGSSGVPRSTWQPEAIWGQFNHALG